MSEDTSLNDIMTELDSKPHIRIESGKRTVIEKIKDIMEEAHQFYESWYKYKMASQFFIF